MNLTASQRTALLTIRNEQVLKIRGEYRAESGPLLLDDLGALLERHLVELEWVRRPVDPTWRARITKAGWRELDRSRFQVAEVDGGFEIRDLDVPSTGLPYTVCSGFNGYPDHAIRQQADAECAGLNDGRQQPDPGWYDHG